MATIFRGKVVTAVAVLSTTVAINAQPIQNRLLLQPPPRSLKDFPNPARPRPLPFVADVGNRALYQTPPRGNKDWPNPAPRPPTPYTFLFYYVAQEVTPPSIQKDWPKAPKPPSITADAILNPNPFQLQPVGLPFHVTEWQQSNARRAGVTVHHHRQDLGPIVSPPFHEGAWPLPTPSLRPIVVEPFRNGLVLPVPVVGVTPFAQYDFGRVSRPILKPQEFQFYYIQDQTRPGFIQYDWPKAPKLPSIMWEQIPNRLVLPVVLTTTPFRQQDWPNASTRQLAKVVDPYNRNVFLPVPQGTPGHQHDWPRPHSAKSLLGSHTIDDLGILSVPVVNPLRRNYDWPLPARPLLLTVIWTSEGTTPIYLPTFKAEWAVNSNQIVGPWAPQPETH